jgi:hypothetical protein
MTNQRKTDWISRAIALVSLVLSLISLLYTARTYIVTHRPYVGITRSNFRVETAPVNKNRLARVEHVFTNVGTVPAWVRVVTNETSATTGGKRYVLPRVGDVKGEGFYLMPGTPGGGVAQSYFVDNQPVSIDKVLSGETALESIFALEYEAPSLFWGSRTRHYHARLVFVSGTNPLSFAQLSAEGD